MKRGVHINHAQYLHNEGIEEWAFEGTSATQKLLPANKYETAMDEGKEQNSYFK